MQAINEQITASGAELITIQSTKAPRAKNILNYTVKTTTFCCFIHFFPSFIQGTKGEKDKLSILVNSNICAAKIFEQCSMSSAFCVVYSIGAEFL